jgi:hypothetical protein
MLSRQRVNDTSHALEKARVELGKATDEERHKLTLAAQAGLKNANAQADRPTLTGEQIVELAQKHTGEKYLLGISVPKNNASWTGPWDSAEFASWIVYQTTGNLFGCDQNIDPVTADAFVGYWERDAQVLGKVISVEQATLTPGSFVLRKVAAGAVGIVVISDGRGGTIEARSTQGLFNPFSQIVAGIWEYSCRESITQLYRPTNAARTGAVFVGILRDGLRSRRLGDQRSAINQPNGACM